MSTKILAEPPVTIRDASVKVEVKRRGKGWCLVGEYPLDLLTTNARDLVHAALIYAAVQGPGFSYYAVTNQAGFAPAVGDVAFPAEVAGAGMARHQPTGAGESVTHGAGGNTSVTVVIFTNNTAGPINAIQGYANFTTNVSAQPCFELAFASTNLPIGDSIKLTITYTIG